MIQFLIIKRYLLFSESEIFFSRFRDIERSPFFLVLQTTSKSFRHFSLPRVMWGVLWEVKRISGILRSSYGGKLFFHLCKLEYFKSKKIWVMEMYLSVHKGIGYRVCTIWQSTILCTGGILTVTGASTDASLVMHWRHRARIISPPSSTCSEDR